MLAILNKSKDVICGLQTSSIKSLIPKPGRMSGGDQPRYSPRKYKEFLFASSVSASEKLCRSEKGGFKNKKPNKKLGGRKYVVY